jgi:nitrite reductase (NADH) small subunit
MRLGPVSEIPVGEGRAYAVDGEMVAVFRLRDGSLRAVSAVCPHAGGPLADGQIDNKIVVCPLHLNAFDLATGCSATGQPALTVYAVHVDDDGHLVVSPLVPTEV